MAQSFTKHQLRILQDTHQQLATLSTLSNAALRDRLAAVREQVFSAPENQQILIPQAMAIAKEACRRQLGFKLHDVQLLAANALINGQIAEMQTGEGKTVSAVPAAIFAGILGHGVHVATPTRYLAKRDYDQLSPVYESLGLNVGLLDEDSGDNSAAYDCDITYGPGYEFGFDYLRDQLLLKKQQQQPAGQDLINSLQGKHPFAVSQIRGLGTAIVDEADNVLLDDATSPQVLSEFQSGPATDQQAVLLASQLARQLERNTHYRELNHQQIELTELGIQKIHLPSISIPVEQLIRPWSQYVETAIRAVEMLYRDVHYVVSEDKIRVIDESTGRIFDDRSWQKGMHQAIEAKENVPITSQSLPLAQITRQRFYRLYKNLAGMTGTADHCHAEFSKIYQLGVTRIPPRKPSQRHAFPFRAFADQPQKWQAIVQSVSEIHRTGRPILLGTRTIAESNLLASLLESANLNFVLLNGRQDAQEAEIIATAGAMGTITIATNLAGRGTDIKLEPRTKDLGGLHVVATECQASYRIDRQLIGRCARQNDPGSSQTFVAADDWLVQTHAPWMVDRLRGIAKNGEISLNIEAKIRRLQKQIERQNYAARLDLLEQNQQRNKILNSHWY